MPRRKRLKSVANGVLTSFVSRNNDLEGYWALGKLYTLALSHSINTVQFDLLSGRLSPDDGQFAMMVFTYQGMFERLLREQKIPHGSVREARITIQFDVPVQQGHYPLLSYGKPLEAVFDVLDQDGTLFRSPSLAGAIPTILGSNQEVPAPPNPNAKRHYRHPPARPLLFRYNNS